MAFEFEFIPGGNIAPIACVFILRGVYDLLKGREALKPPPRPIKFNPGLAARTVGLGNILSWRCKLSDSADSAAIWSSSYKGYAA